MVPTRAILVIAMVLLCRSAAAAVPPPPPAELCTSDHPWLLRSAVVLGGVGLMMVVDEPVHDWVIDNKNGASETFSDIVRPFGEWPAFVGVSVGCSAVGLIAGDDAILAAGERAAMSIAVSAVIEGVGKYALSRRRPKFADGWSDFEFFSNRSSMPSGHGTVAFALAKSLSDDIDRGWASWGLYSLAVTSSLARLVDNMHWLSDLGLGAAVGYASAEFVTDNVMKPAHSRRDDGGPSLSLLSSGAALTWRF